MSIGLALGPLLFNWPAERVDAFYAAMADAPVDRVYLGEVVCGKREPLLREALERAAERLARAGKEVILSTLALPANPVERRWTRRGVEAAAAGLVEANDLSALPALGGRPFVAGPLLNIYNEAAARELVGRGCRRLCGNVELSLDALAAIGRACPDLEIELFAFGRLPLALSGRCYHARLHGLHKDACRFVCGEDPDGRAVRTLEGGRFLALNGVQVISDGVQLAAFGPAELRAAGVAALRLSPQDMDMAAVARAFRDVLDGRAEAGGLAARLQALNPPGPFVQGYPRGVAGWRSDLET